MLLVLRQFTAAALLKLQDEKKVELDDLIARQSAKVPADRKAVTVRHLLHHTSGVQSGFRSEWQFDSRERASCVARRQGAVEAGEEGALHGRA